MSGNRKLGRTSSQRKAMLRGMVTYLFENGKIETTYTRAKEVAAVADSMITLAKVENKSEELAAYRKALSYITKWQVARKLFDEIAPGYEKLAGGYTQILKLGPRRGDAAEMAIVRLVPAAKEEAPAEKPAKKPAAKKAPAKKAAPVEEAAPAEEVAPAEET
jgi:large subunit ribosomal protein L17